MFALGLGAHLLVRNSGKKNRSELFKTRDRIRDQARMEQEKRQHSWKRKVGTAEISMVWNIQITFLYTVFQIYTKKEKEKKRK